MEIANLSRGKAATERAQREIERKTKEYLEAGNKITHVPFGVSGENLELQVKGGALRYKDTKHQLAEKSRRDLDARQNGDK